VTGSAHAGAELTIDLDAVRHNYSLLRNLVRPAECAAVIKADAYGIGADHVVPVLAAAGCRRFFVATLDEGIAVRQRTGDSATVYVLNGLLPADEQAALEAGVVPVLNDLGQIERWSRRGCDRGAPLRAVLHVDTGMSRLGLDENESAMLRAAPERLSGLSLDYVISHLACAESAESPMNAIQRQRFIDFLDSFPGMNGGLANSSGIFLGPSFHFDLVRPGAALYGINPTPGSPNPMTQVVTLKGKIIQVRRVDTPRTVGYGATHRVAGPTRIATVPVGYADGFLRSLSGRATCRIGGIVIPIVGRVSMDLITLDVSEVPPEHAQPGCEVDLIGADIDVDAVAAAAGTIGYEILTALGRRYRRRYTDGRSA
jgi:alanine racemase